MDDSHAYIVSKGRTAESKHSTGSHSSSGVFDQPLNSHSAVAAWVAGVGELLKQLEALYINKVC